MPIGKGGSFTPLTWRNVDTGNPAAFFNGAAAGADRLVDQSQKINAVEDSRLLNEALNRQRLGQPAEFDRRVDQIALQESAAPRVTSAAATKQRLTNILFLMSTSF